ncbi:MAG: hypothetical protein IJO79_03560 [Firmicutes bacterium]|nr:hypothetical protein [Clostridiales bacterium]MBQ9931406.1 hypothetical protein [Bacillota bacterium]
MKQLIVLAGVLPLLLVFMMQYTLDQRNNAQISWLQDQVYTVKEQAKQEGYFTPEMVDDLRMAISERLEIEPQEVQISATGTPQYRTNEFEETQRRGIIRYRIEVPMKQLMAGGSLFGISKEANQGTYVIEGITASERLPF